MTFLTVTGIIIGVVITFYWLTSRKPLKTAFRSMASGGAALLALSFFGSAIHITHSVSFCSTIIALSLGVPGVVLMAAGKLLLV